MCILILHHLNQEYLRLLSETKVQHGIMIFSGSMNDDMLDMVSSYIDEQNKNSLFYMAYNASSSARNQTPNKVDNLIWHQVNIFPIF